jgi:hypothetical protein
MIAVFLYGGNVVADVLGALDIGLQESMLPCLYGKLLLGRLRGRGKFPTVSRQGDIGNHKKNNAGENDSFPQCEIALHQVLE